MAELPSYFEHRLSNPGPDRSSGLYEFSYDEAEKVFTIGKTAVKVADFDPYRFNEYELLADPDEETIELAELAEQLAILPPASGAIGGAKLHDWVWNNQDALPPTRQVMHAAMATAYEHPETIIFDEDDEHGFMGFAVHLREPNGKPDGLRFQVFGNCACMERDLYGLFIEGTEHGFTQYGLHNADLPAQRAGLYAGLGHLAKLAAES